MQHGNMPDKRSAEDSSANLTRKTARTAYALAASSSTTAAAATGSVGSSGSGGGSPTPSMCSPRVASSNAVGGASAAAPSPAYGHPVGSLGPAGSGGGPPPLSLASITASACSSRVPSSNATGKQPAGASNWRGELKEIVMLAEPDPIAPPITFRALTSSFDDQIETILKTLSAGAHADDFSFTATEKEDFRCYVQVQHTGKPWTNSWQEIREHQFKLAISDNIGVNIMPFVDTKGICFQMIPYGPAEPCIVDSFNSGVLNLAQGTSMQWRFDNPVKYSCGDAKASFIVVKIPGVPSCNGSDAAQVSLEVEKFVRKKYYLPIDLDMNEPCWLNTSVIASRRDFWAKHCTDAHKMNKQLFKQYSKMQSSFMRLHRAHKVLQAYTYNLEEWNTTIENDLKLSETALKDIQTALEEGHCHLLAL